MSQGSDKAKKMLESDRWQNMSSAEFSFLVNGLFGMPAQIKQDLLEMRQPQQRLDVILEIVNSIQQSF